MKVFGIVLASVVMAVSFGALAETIEERLAPAGSLCMAGDPCASAKIEVAAAGAARSGQAVYDSKCATCHATGAAGAPKMGDVAAWAPRLEKGIEVLYANSIAGINAMPAKGLCFDCSDDEMKASVDYMVEAAK